MQQIFESYTLKSTIDYGDQNPCPPLGFGNAIKYLSKKDPMAVSSVFSAIQRITNAIAQMPWELKSYEDIDIPKNHYFYHLFDNCLQTRFIFVKQIVKDVITVGNGYTLIQRKDGQPVNLIYLPAGTCSPIISQTDGKIYYNISLNNKINGRYARENVLHFFMDSKDGIVGIPLLFFADNAIKLSWYTDKAALDYYQSGMRITGVLSTDAPRLNEKQRKDIRDSYLAGMDATNGIAVLEGNMHFEDMSNSAKDASLIESRNYNVNDIARYFNISPVLLGNLEHTQYGSIEQASTDFVSSTLSPWIIMIEEELNRKILTKPEMDKYYIDINEEVLIKTDRSNYANYISILLSKGVISVNEARQMLRYNKIEGGDVYILPYQGQKDGNGNVIPGYNKPTQNPTDNNQNNQNNQNENSTDN